MSRISSKIVPLPKCHPIMVANGYTLRWTADLPTGHIGEYQCECGSEETEVVVVWGRLGRPDRIYTPVLEGPRS